MLGDGFALPSLHNDKLKNWRTFWPLFALKASPMLVFTIFYVENTRGCKMRTHI
jgi:hypothetical protein